MSDWIPAFALLVASLHFVGGMVGLFILLIRREPQSASECDVVDLDMRMVWVVTVHGQVDSVWLGKIEAMRAMHSYISSSKPDMGPVVRHPCGGLTAIDLELEYRRHLVMGPV
ncbi:MAG: hypothetical protein COA38_20505 [Fluviicola sp.]|nr:MAG: hypothetical protein COA38_20505 [Fluviicola sp.]